MLFILMDIGLIMLLDSLIWKLIFLKIKIPMIL